MLFQQQLICLILPLFAHGQTTLLGSEAATSSATGSATGQAIGDVANPANVTYASYSSTATYSTATTLSSLRTLSANASSAASASTSTDALTYLIGATRTQNATASRTSSSATATNTQPCNGYPEFCNRKYSNLTMVAAHNFPFIKKNNAARNQEIGVIGQLDDGIRMLQAQAHYVNETLYFCHTNCNLLNAGTVESQFVKIREWLENPIHRYEVVTLLIGNYQLVDVNLFTPAIQNSGLAKYTYEPPKWPMALSDWPTLTKMILENKRVVFMMDYQATKDNNLIVPNILDEFGAMWETPYSPTNQSFPCDIQRPSPTKDRPWIDSHLYMANHNLNTDLKAAFGIDLLVPNVPYINLTNSATNDFGALGRTANDCTAMWNRPPNFLLVDFYNKGNLPGSVFQVAVEMNGVTYNRQCCSSISNGSAGLKSSGLLMVVLGILAFSVLF